MTKTVRVTSALAGILTLITLVLAWIAITPSNSPSSGMIIIPIFMITGVVCLFCFPLFLYGIIQLRKRVRYNMIFGLEFVEKIILFLAWGVFFSMNYIFVHATFFNNDRVLNMIDYTNRHFHAWVTIIVGLLLFYYGLVIYRNFTARRTRSTQ